MSLLIIFVYTRLVIFLLFPAWKAVPGAGFVLLSTVLKCEHREGDEGMRVHRVLREANPTNTIDMTLNHLGPAQTKAVSCNSWLLGPL